MVFLTSTGFANPKLFQLLSENARNKIKKACIIITATLPEKEKHPVAIRTREIMLREGVSRVDYVDIVDYDVNNLREYDLVYILGGNSCHLHYHIYKSGADKVLLKMIDEKKIIVGVSAGALLLTTGNKYTKYYGEILGIEEGDYFAKGLGVTNDILFPHYDMMCDRVPDLEDRLVNLEQDQGIVIKRLNNMDFIFVGDDNSVKEYIGSLSEIRAC